MRGLLGWLWRHRAWYAGGLLALGAVDAAQTVLPFLIRRLIDDLAAGTGGSIAGLCAGMLGIAALMVGLRFLWRILILGASRRIRRDLREQLHRALLAQDHAFHATRSPGSLMALAGNDLDAVAQACGFGVLALFDAILMILFAAGAMLHLDARLALLACAPLPLIALVHWRAGRAIHRRFETVQAEFGALTELVREALAGIRTVKAHAREPGLEQALGRANRRNRDANLALARIHAVFEPALALLSGLAMVIVLAVGGGLVIDGSLTLGGFVAFTAFLAMLAWPMMAIGWAVNLVGRGLASFTRVQAAITAVPAVRDPPRPRPLPDDTTLALLGVRVRPADAERDLLADIAVELPAGGSLGLVGPTGSGKSVLCDLLVRLIDPVAGEVRLGGVPLPELALADLRRAVALVPQDPAVFALPIRENLRFAAPEADDAAVEAAARAVGLHDEIAALPQSYDSPVGEGGVTLSGGQRQRLAIARALLARPRLLVLDDCLSALDAATESRVLAHLRRVSRGLTTVVASHRLRTVAACDLILVLDHGRVVERGTHAALVRQGGLYARLDALQRAEQALEERA